MEKAFIILFIVALVIFVGEIAYFNAKKVKIISPNNQVILFYGERCSHCKELESFIRSFRVKEKVLFIEKEVYDNKENQYLMLEKARQCGIRTNKLGVPFLWTSSKCYIGAPEIKDFFVMEMKKR